MGDKELVIISSFKLVIDPIKLPINELISYLLVGAQPSNGFHNIGYDAYCKLLRQSCDHVLCRSLHLSEINLFGSVIKETVDNIVSMGINYYLSKGVKITKVDTPVIKKMTITITGTEYDQSSIDYLALLGYKIVRPV